MLEHELLTGQIIGAAIEVYRILGPGLLEPAYQSCLAREFSIRGLLFQKELKLPIEYKGVRVEPGYRLDFVVANAVVIEVKAVERVLPVHEAQLLTYLRLTNFPWDSSSTSMCLS
jgi:GxxExxY protein